MAIQSTGNGGSSGGTTPPAQKIDLDALAKGFKNLDTKPQREAAAKQLRAAATQALKDPETADDAKLTLGLLDRGELPAMGGLLRIDTGEQIRAGRPLPPWQPR